MRTLYRKLGFLTIALIPYTIVAVVLQRRYMPGSFPWTAPLRALDSVLREEWMPVMCAITLAIGASVWISRDDLAWARAATKRQIDRAALRQWAVRTALLVVPAFAVGAWKSLWNPFDFMAVFAIGATLGAWRWTRQTVVRSLSNFLYVAVVFTLVSYSFSVFKGLLFRFRMPHDAEVIAVEHAILRFYPHEKIAPWAAQNPWAVDFSDTVYLSLFKHFTLASVLLIGTRDQQRRNELIGALIVAYMLGGVAHYVWPAIGPTYAMPERYAYLFDGPYRTRLLREMLYRNTQRAATNTATHVYLYGYIAAMPSLHLAHEAVMLWYARVSRIALALSIVFFVMTFAATLILGWHYPIDAVAGVLLAALAVGLVQVTRKNLFPEFLQPQNRGKNPRNEGLASGSSL